MIILYVCTNADLAGAPIHVRSLIKEFRNKAKVIAVFGEDGAIAKELRSEGFQVHIINQLRSDINIVKDSVAFFKLLFLIKNSSPNIVHLHSTKAGFLGRLACFFTSTPWIYSVHGWGWRGFPKVKKKIIFSLEKFLSFIPNGSYLYVSNSVELEARTQLRINKSRGRVIYNGVTDYGYVLPPEENLKILMAARVCEAKDHETLIRAFEILKIPASLTLCGEGTNTKEFQNKVKSWAPLRHNEIRLLGVEKNVFSLMKENNLFVLISNFEALPLSIIEAMSCARPVIASNVGGCGELIQNELNGLLVTEKNIDELAKSIERFENVNFRTGLGLNARKYYEDNFTDLRMFKEIWKLYLDEVV